MRIQIVAAALCALALVVTPAQAKIKSQTIEYKDGDATLEGWLVYDDAKTGRRPGILVFPQWNGPSGHEKDVAERLAKLGYVAFVADVYGKGVRPNTPQAAGAEAAKYMRDRPMLLTRAKAALEQLRKSNMVDGGKLAAIGYCFGAAPALDLARDGAPLVDVVAFHGSLGTSKPESAKNIKGHVLALHGAADPLVNAQAVAAFEKEMTDGKVDWQITLYGGAMHAFTDKVNPSSPEHGTQYDANADKRSWQAMVDLLKSTL